MVQLEENGVKRHSICWHMMTSDSSADLRAILQELYAELRPALERNTARGHAPLVPQVMCTLGFKQPGHSRGSRPTDLDCAEPCQPSVTELSASQQVYQIPTMQTNMQSELSTAHSAIKAPSHDEFVYQQETFSFHQCTDRM